MKYWLRNALLLILPVCSMSGRTADAPAADAIYEYRNWECEIKGKQANLKTKQKLVIFNQRGAVHAGVAIIENDYLSLKEFSLKIIDPSGKVVVTRSKKDLVKFCGFGSGFQLYSDICAYQCQADFPRYPYSVECEYTEELKSLFFWHGEWIQDEIPVTYASYTLTCAPDLQFSHHTSGMEIIPTRTDVKNQTIWKWEVQDVPAMKKIDYQPDGSPERIKISFLPERFYLSGYEFQGNSWNDVGKWYASLAADCYLSPPSHIDSVPATTSDKISRIKNLYEDLIGRTRYVSVSIGISGWKPNPAALTQKRGYGDCKDLATLLISELRNQGIEAHPILALTRGDGLIDTAHPGFDFNHLFVAAMAGADTFWLDPTCNDCRFGNLPPMDEDISAILISESGGVLVRTPSSAPKDNLVSRKTSLFLDGRRNIRISASISYWGNYALYIKGQLSNLSEDETRTFIDRILPGGIKRYIIEDYGISNLGGIAEPVIITLSARAKKPADELGGIIYVPFDFYESLVSFETLNLENRTIPVDLGYPDLKVDSIELRWDSALTIDSIAVPSDDSAVFNLGRTTCSFTKDGQSVRAFLSKSYNSSLLPVEEFENFRLYRSRTKEVAGGNIRFFRPKM